VGASPDFVWRDLVSTRRCVVSQNKAMKRAQLKLSRPAFRTRPLVGNHISTVEPQILEQPGIVANVLQKALNLDMKKLILELNELSYPRSRGFITLHAVALGYQLTPHSGLIWPQQRVCLFCNLLCRCLRPAMRGKGTLSHARESS